MGPPQRQPRSRGPRGPRQSKAHQQHLPPEVMRHQGRPAASEPMQIKIDPLVENLTPASSSGISTNVSESSQATSMLMHIQFSMRMCWRGLLRLLMYRC
jgi:hypothetical protein